MAGIKRGEYHQGLVGVLWKQRFSTQNQPVSIPKFLISGTPSPWSSQSANRARCNFKWLCRSFKLTRVVTVGLICNSNMYNTVWSKTAAKDIWDQRSSFKLLQLLVFDLPRHLLSYKLDFYCFSHGSITDYIEMCSIPFDCVSWTIKEAIIKKIPWWISCLSFQFNNWFD